MDRRSLFIGGLLLLQAVIPLHYYTLSDDPHDERFSWRMFSPERMLRCGVEFRVGGSEAPLNLEQHFHTAWISLTRRGRHDVTRAMGERICLTHAGHPVHLRYLCREVDGTRLTLSDGLSDICPDGGWR